MKIKTILTIYYSKADRNGNCYWAFIWTQTNTGKSVSATSSGGEGNITNAFYRYNGGAWGGYYVTTVGLGIREFNRLTKNWPHAGCEPSSIAEFVRTRLKRIQLPED